MIKTPLNKAIKSKAMIAGMCLMGLGVYLILSEGKTTDGLTVIGVGLGIMGIRDAQ